MEAVGQATGENTVKGLKSWLSYLIRPQSIQSDNGTHFTAGVVQEWAWKEGIQWVFRTPYYLQMNGTVECTKVHLKWVLKPHKLARHCECRRWYTELAADCLPVLSIALFAQTLLSCCREEKKPNPPSASGANSTGGFTDSGVCAANPETPS